MIRVNLNKLKYSSNVIFIFVQPYIEHVVVGKKIIRYIRYIRTTMSLSTDYISNKVI